MPEWHSFYANNLILNGTDNLGTNITLIPTIDYSLYDLDSNFTARVGMSVYKSIVISNTSFNTFRSDRSFGSF